LRIRKHETLNTKHIIQNIKHKTSNNKVKNALCKTNFELFTLSLSFPPGLLLLSAYDEGAEYIHGLSGGEMK